MRPSLTGLLRSEALAAFLKLDIVQIEVIEKIKMEWMNG
jgi:hypothetical protein